MCTGEENNDSAHRSRVGGQEKERGSRHGKPVRKDELWQLRAASKEQLVNWVKNE